MKLNIVFLHIPKTAGQTVHSELCKYYDENEISPIRVHAQSPDSSFVDHEKYKLFSGHLDWHDLEKITSPRYVFSLFRDPLDRIISFYNYLKDKSETLSPQELEKPENTGLNMIKNRSIDDYFFSEEPGLSRFITDHYDNFYTNYFCTRRFRGSNEVDNLTMQARIQRAVDNAKEVDDLFGMHELTQLEQKLNKLTNKTFSISGKYMNVNKTKTGENKTDSFFKSFRSEDNANRVREMAKYDYQFLEAVGLSFPNRNA